MEDNLRQYWHVDRYYSGPFVRGTRVEEIEVKDGDLRILVVRVTPKFFNPYLIVPGRIVSGLAIPFDERVVSNIGQLVSVVKPISDTGIRSRLVDLLTAYGIKGEINFWD